AQVRVDESQAYSDLLKGLILHRAQEVVRSVEDPVAALGSDEGLHSILEASLLARQLAYAAIVDTHDVVIAHSDGSLVGQPMPEFDASKALTDKGPIALLKAIYTPGGKILEIRTPLLLGGKEFGSIRVGVSTLLIRDDFDKNVYPPLLAAIAAVGGASFIALLLAQVLLRPIHVIRSGISRLGRGEFGVMVDLPRDDEFAELGQFFNAVSARLSADRAQTSPQPIFNNADGHHAEDAVAVFDAQGTLVFANDAMRDSLPGDLAARNHVEDLWPASHPFRAAVEDARASKQPRDPATVSMPSPDSGERLVLAHPLEGPGGRKIGVVLIARNLDYLTQVRTTLSYSRKLAALSRLSAGIAHEVKNPLNATVIHLELLKQQLASPSSEPAAVNDHVSVIAAQMRRLDEVVQGFLRFIRPEDLRLELTSVASLVESINPIVAAEAERNNVHLVLDIPAGLPDIHVDRGMMEQALLNLAINACQAMPNGGRLRIAGAVASGRRVAIICEDTGCGIPPEHLDKIFNLYFTTKEGGSGIGLSMVYRTVQLHDGELEVQSTPGRGATFRVLLPQA
ncbi:MAG TPA: ATP-binding protein, partial [Vicinamibacterales bacterium]|nr:ATP-binding protein [Vicinamibacterales bacterium]